MVNINCKNISIIEIDRVMDIIEDGREELRIQGNGQWQDGYPNKDDLIKDINDNNLYGVYIDSLLVGLCAFTYKQVDYQQKFFLEGGWSNYEEPYIVLHRIAVKKEYRGKHISHYLFNLFEEIAKEKNIHYLRLDTHEKNIIMRSLIEKHGFKYMGKARLIPPRDRVMYEKVI